MLCGYKKSPQLNYIESKSCCCNTPRDTQCLMSFYIYICTDTIYNVVLIPQKMRCRFASRKLHHILQCSLMAYCIGK